MLKGERVMVYRDSLREFSNSVYHMAGSGQRFMVSRCANIVSPRSIVQHFFTNPSPVLTTSNGLSYKGDKVNSFRMSSSNLP